MLGVGLLGARYAPVCRAAEGVSDREFDVFDDDGGECRDNVARTAKWSERET